MTSLTVQWHTKIEENHWLSNANRFNSVNFNATTLKLAEKFDHSFSHMFIFLNIFALVHGFDAVTIAIGYSVEPVTLSKYVKEYEQMWKWMVEFLSKFQCRGIKIDRVYSIRVAKSMIFFNILRAIAPSVTSSWAIVFFAMCLRLLPLVDILLIFPLHGDIHPDPACRNYHYFVEYINSVIFYQSKSLNNRLSEIMPS